MFLNFSRIFVISEDQSRDFFRFLVDKIGTCTKLPIKITKYKVEYPINRRTTKFVFTAGRLCNLQHKVSRTYRAKCRRQYFSSKSMFIGTHFSRYYLRISWWPLRSSRVDFHSLMPADDQKIANNFSSDTLSRGEVFATNSIKFSNNWNFKEQSTIGWENAFWITKLKTFKRLFIVLISENCWYSYKQNVANTSFFKLWFKLQPGSASAAPLLEHTLHPLYHY